jgi:hypothetical protein
LDNEYFAEIIFHIVLRTPKNSGLKKELSWSRFWKCLKKVVLLCDTFDLPMHANYASHDSEIFQSVFRKERNGKDIFS